MTSLNRQRFGVSGDVFLAAAAAAAAAVVLQRLLLHERRDRYTHTHDACSFTGIRFPFLTGDGCYASATRNLLTFPYHLTINLKINCVFQIYLSKAK